MSVFHSLEHATHVSWVLWSALFAAGLLFVTGLAVRSRLAAAGGGLVPDQGLTARNVVEMLVEMLAGLAEQNMGPKWRSYFPFIATLFFFILVSNLIGLIPGLAGATSNANTTWAWAGISFAVHQFVGIREHGFGYIRHFLGPIWWLAPLMLFIETFAHIARPFSLSMRLFGNMMAHEMLVVVLLILMPYAFPLLAFATVLGILVVVIQALIFSILAMAYIGGALEEAH